MQYQYKKINMETWNRSHLFQYYIQKMPIVMSLTVTMDITNLLVFSKQNNLKFYPAMIWVVSSILNAHDEFKYGWDEQGHLIKWNFISPSYVIFHPEQENFTKMVTPFSHTFHGFYKQFILDQTRYEHCHGFIKQQPPNFFDVSCLPWVKYSHFDVHVFDEGKFLAPVVTWGKYELEHETYHMPLTLNVHHAVADGFHAARFFQETQALLSSFS